MSLITGPFLMMVFLTLIGTKAIRLLFYYIFGAVQDAWFMPSTRSATMASVTYLSLTYYGFDRIEFTTIFVFAAFLCYDAVRLHRVSGEHAAVINRLARELKRLDPECDLPSDALEAEGSSLIQILVGIIVGILLTLLIGPAFAFQHTSF